ncbi:unnamed protein product [Darwinula stevensoni]|uniref:Bestrophin homolog n=1 Tax=Darwinula stevensoni TaxID=69355 RepID=A0A7R9A4A2_9CRUS|nr:unnamed protein product [Darwinula stevensoni]CAG0893223.1 unnamed protein product [Darwinula stevensoni]
MENQKEVIGLMEEGERLMMQAMVGKNMRSMFWVPHMWAASILQKAREEQLIGSDMGLRSILDTLSAFRRACSVCHHVDYIQVPLVYSQVVTIACYSFYSAALLGSQFIDSDTEKVIDIYVPVITLFQLVLYVGWLKVAESLINPYGENDDDFDLNWLIDRHINVSHVMGNGLNRDFKRYTWEEMFPWLFNKSLAPKPLLLAFAHKMDMDITSKGQSGEDKGRLPNDPAVLQGTTLMRIMRGHLAEDPSDAEPPPPPPLILQTNTSIPELDPDEKDFLLESRHSCPTMPVTYNNVVATSSKFGCFWRLLFKWKGSVYKLVWPDLLVWLILYYIISIVYRVGLDEDQRKVFEKIAIYCHKFSEFIPLTFLMGFYVTTVVNRWWQHWDALPWPDNTAVFVTVYLEGQASISSFQQLSKTMRRTIMRYMNLAMVHAFSLISVPVQKRFPTLQHLVTAGLLEENELPILDKMSKSVKKIYWMPLVWAATLATKARREGKIRDDMALRGILDHIVEYRRRCGRSLHIDLINVPLVYSQVVTLAAYSFFASCLFGRQFINHENLPLDIYVPVFTICQFLFYMGWLKVAETLINPFGEDDDDFDLNWLIDRHVKVSYMIVDGMHEEHPELTKDQYWDQMFPECLPYNEDVLPKMEPVNSAQNLTECGVEDTDPLVAPESRPRLKHAISEPAGYKANVTRSWSLLSPVRRSQSLSYSQSIRRFFQRHKRTPTGSCTPLPTLREDPNEEALEEGNGQNLQESQSHTNVAFAQDDSAIDGVMHELRTPPV